MHATKSVRAFYHLAKRMVLDVDVRVVMISMFRMAWIDIIIMDSAARYALERVKSRFSSENFHSSLGGFF